LSLWCHDFDYRIDRKKLFFMFENAKIGDKFIKISTGNISTVLNKNSTSIELFNTKNLKSKDQFGNYSGIDSSNWYERSWFERKFKI
jgi:hypothetical protein